jgi:hypothetical protein
MVGDAPGFLEGLIPNIKTMMTRDDVGKLEVLNNSFKDDPRWGGGFQDKYGNPMLIWNDKPYYINKPGMSGTDFGTFVGEIIKFIPAMRIMKKAKSAKQVAGMGVPTYAVTESASQLLEAGMTPETTKAKEKTTAELGEEIGSATALGVGVDLATKGIGGAIVPVVKSVKEATKNMFPKFSKDLIKSKYPLTKGQAEAPLVDKQKGLITSQTTPQLEAEDVARFSATTDPGAKSIVKGFDENQLNLIKEDAKQLQDTYGTGTASNIDSELVPTASAEGIETVVSTEATRVKNLARESYNYVKDAAPGTIATQEGLNRVSNQILNSIQVTARELEMMPLLAREIKYLKKLNKLSSNPNFKGVPFKLIQGYQKTINNIARTAAPGSPEAMYLGQIKSQVDDAVFNGIEQGFITGDQAVLDSLKEATDNYRTYIGLTGKGKAKSSLERSANAILEKISNPDYTADKVANALFGHAKLNTPAQMKLVLKKLKENLPTEKFDEVNALLKDAILEKAFSGSGKSGVTRTNIINNFTEIFEKNQFVAKELFNPEEIKQIRQFKNNVLPTLWAEIKLNPSGTGYTMLSALENKGLLNFGKMIPLIGEGVVSGIQSSRATGSAREMISQYIERSYQPLFSQSIQATTRPEIVETMSQDDLDSSPSVLGILDSIDASTRNKIQQAVQ